MSISPEVARLRSQFALGTRYGHSDLDKVRTELRTATTAEYIRRIVDEAPPLSDEQRSRLAAILCPASYEAAAA